VSKRNAIILAVVVLVAVAANLIVPKPFDPEIVLHAEYIPMPFSLPLLGNRLPNTIIATWVTMTVLVVVSILATRNMQLVPSGLQNLIEMVIEMLHNFFEGMVGQRVRQFFPVVATLFLFILVSNWMGLLPGYLTIGIWEEHHEAGVQTVESVTHEQQVEAKEAEEHHEEGERVLVPFLRSDATDLNTTVALAICSVVAAQVYGFRAAGLGYLTRFINLGKLAGFFAGLVGRGPRRGIEGLLTGIADVLIGILEVFDELTKILSFSFRLFGNIFAGEVLLIVIAFLMPLVASLPFMALELFVGFMQAFIFAVLSLAFFGLAVAHGEHEHEH
jgi:F-type H+-transporting ATPase subunit a